MSLNQSQRSVAEGESSTTGTVTLSSIASENVTVKIIINDGSANGNVE